MEAALMKRLANTKVLTSFTQAVLDVALVATTSPLTTTPNFTQLRKFHSPKSPL
jgi:hypothetical protein